MLAVTTPLLLLLMMKSKWNYSMMYMSAMFLPSMMYLYSHHQPINMNQMWGTDLMSSMLIMLTMWIMPLVMCASQLVNLTHTRPTLLTQTLVTLTFMLILCFMSAQLILFYVFFEASLIPTLIIVLKWGYQPERLQAGMYLMLYTIAASLPLLLGIALMYKNNTYKTLINMFPAHSTSSSMWLMMNLAFMVKLPMFFFHLWLPKAHVEAPVAGSMVLAAVLLKLGGYGMLRFIYLIPSLNPTMKLYIIVLSLWGGMMTSLICVRQQDMKSLIAYSSVGHMSLVLAGVLTNLPWGVWGAMAMMISHGLLSSSLFATADMTYTSSNSRNLIMNKGINLYMPTMSMLWFIMCAANMAAPPSTNLMSEIMLMSASTTVSKLVLIPMGIMSGAAAGYSLMLYVSMNHGPNNSNMSYMTPYNSRNMFIITAHTIPVVMIMLMPMIISLW